ncbi:GNAT family N-acetyltransferase [Rhodoferax aquaticus]|uniref:N-acetyltransferase n=1 Tax=Rhodoferax aquaticus TaxID=2527691 RepID=A0A515EQZ4_9BURK|nr:GNAT family N-acetyltransferase [Rhodoferax aquaticus]QDL55045.1 N-acetyltransferase [Rhodoferax aquaticus]
MTFTIPTLESDRLLLRAFRESDFDTMAAFYASPVSATYGGPCNREDAWRKFAVYSGHWALRGYGPWALEEKASGAYVGLAGMWFPEAWVEPEITWALMLGHHGKGFATEAATRALQAAYQDFGWQTAVSVVLTDNTPSNAVAQRMGAQREGTIAFRGAQAYVYRHIGPQTRES